MGDHGLGDVGAVIVTHSRPDLAVASATDVVAALGDPSRVVVVVNLEEHASSVDVPGIGLVVNEAPVGYGANLNRGERALPASVRAVALLNDDVRLTREALARLAAALDDPAVALVGPAMVGDDGVSQATAFRFPTVASEVVDALLGPSWLVRRLRRRVGRVTDSGRVEWVQGAATLVRRDAFRAVGGFEEAFHLYYEEVDLAKRLTSAGWRVVHEPGAVVVHGAHATLGTSYLPSFGASRAQYVRTHWPRRRRVLLRLGLALAYAWDVAWVAMGTVLGRDRGGARRAALRVKLDRRPRWSLTPEGATAPPPP